MRAVGGHLSQTVLGVGRGSGSPACVSHQVPLGLHLLSLRPPLCGPGLLGRLSPGPSHLGPGHLSPASAEASPGLPSSPLPSQAALLRYSQRLEQVWDWTATASLSPTRPGDRNQDGIPPPPPPHHRARCPPARCGRQLCVCWRKNETPSCPSRPRAPAQLLITTCFPGRLSARGNEPPGDGTHGPR